MGINPNGEEPKRIIIIALALFLFIAPLIWCGVAYALEPPDSDPEVVIETLYANVNLRETGDVLIYGMYDIPYASLPETDADLAYVFTLIDVDGETQLGAIVPYVAFDGGYNEGAFSFYFSAADNLTTDQQYIIRISQSPAFFGSPESWDYTMPLTSWTSYTSQADNQAELAINLIAIAENLEEAHGETLLQSSASGTVLSDPTGENYFRGVIYGCQVIVPDLFLVQQYIWETGDRARTTDAWDDFDERFDGTWLGTATENTSATFGMTAPTLMGFWIGVPVMVGVTILSSLKFKTTDPALIVACLLMIMLGFMGWMSAAVFAIIYQLFGIYIGYLWFYNKA